MNFYTPFEGLVPHTGWSGGFSPRWGPNYPRGWRFRGGATTGMTIQQQPGEAVDLAFSIAPELESNPDSTPMTRRAVRDHR